MVSFSSTESRTLINMKILFLDFDGVLNLSSQKGVDASFDRVSMVNLEFILNKEPNLKIVVSSAWRHKGIEAVREVLKNNGLDPRKVIDVTGEEQSEDERDHRGYQVECWLKNHPEVKSFAILDDKDDFVPLKHKLIRTKNKSGLTQSKAEKVLEILNESVEKKSERSRL